MGVPEILALVAQLTYLGIKLHAEGNRTATADEIAALNADFRDASTGLAQAIAARRARDAATAG